ncbi:ABC transporter substrate-binding protein [Jiangella alkaliphila]|uniref:Peptide/nickel transport system substrate-binding protein n=1 Tax=Jiangella alkaliphila TaxID=419479 RepID=A0A1H2LJB7_9ACTN|nr:ABC transporter substrate-binding protein [Jiangella alkaliphila]SDU81110.1 peptide/nickel transport system substrate-binding protein [Jiangella alkaliphila]
MIDGAQTPVRSRQGALRAPALMAALATALVAAACSATTQSDEPAAGGTLHYLSSQPEFTHLDPQRMYLPEDIAFATSFLQRTLTAYSYDADPADVQLVADLATDTGSANDDATEWSFTLRDGVTFEDGSAITCTDVKFGVSRAFDPEFILTSGISRAIRLLDVPAGPDGNPVYTGPYTTDPGDVAAFDRAVSCSGDDRTVTFRLARPAGDFGDAVSTPAFGPVPEGTPAGVGYDTAPVSSGPYRVDQDAGEHLTLVRNDAWDRDTDPLRPAYPDRVEVQLDLDPDELDQRMIADSGADRTAIAAAVDPAAASAFPRDDALDDRTVTGPGLGVRYLAINTARVPLTGHRRAIAAAVDRAALHEALGGDVGGTPADGLLPHGLRSEDAAAASGSPGAGPPAGDPARAQTLLAEAGAPMPPLSFAFLDTPANQAAATVLQQSLGTAGITLDTVPMGPAEYYPAIQDPQSPHALMLGSWAPTWMDGATVADLLTPAGGAANLSRYDDAAFTADADAASGELDPAARAAAWSELDARAVADAVVVPLRFDQQLRLVGSQVRDAHAWAPYGSVAFGAVWVEPED